MSPHHPTLASIQQAHARIASGLRSTPFELSRPLSARTGMSLFIKHDHLQVTGSFKERGARHALLCLNTRQRALGVIAASAGNHALGLAYHGRALGIPITVVMPRTAPRVKAGRCHALGARVLLHGDSFEEANAHALALSSAHGYTYVHPFDDPAVIAGQGTLALEMLQAVPDVDALILPVGGGGLLAGAAALLRSLRPALQLIGVEPAHAACFGRACAAGKSVQVPLLPTVADGLAVAQCGAHAFEIARARVDRMVKVTEDEIASAMLALNDAHGLMIEGAGATALAACLGGHLPELLAGKRVALAVTGRNVDPSVHARALLRARHLRPEPAVVA